MNKVSTDRQAFDYFKDNILRPAGAGSAIINERTFILEAKLNNQSRDMTFRILETKKDSDREIKLDLEDIALITQIRLSCQKVREENGYTIPLTPDLTYADKDFFVGVLGGKKEVDAVNAIWDGGKLSLESKSTKRLSQFDTYNLLHVPQVQLKEDGQPIYGTDNEGRGYYSIINPFVLSGKAENDIRLTLGYMISEIMEGKHDATGTAYAGDVYNVVRLRLRGFVGLNAASKYSAWLEGQPKV